MLDKAIFAQGVGLLSGNYGRELEAAVSREWYSHLAHLTDEQFITACRRCIAEETYWPNVALILEKSGATKPGDAFQVVVDALKEHGGYRFLPSEISLSWDQATWAGIKAIGGLAAITNCESEKKWEKMRRDFAAAYAGERSGAKVLPSTTGSDPRVKQLTQRVAKDMALPRGDR